MVEMPKPCPFCGETFVGPWQEGQFYRVLCWNGDCEADGPLGSTPEDAITAWNRPSKEPDNE